MSLPEKRHTNMRVEYIRVSDEGVDWTKEYDSLDGTVLILVDYGISGAIVGIELIRHGADGADDSWPDRAGDLLPSGG